MKIMKQYETLNGLIDDFHGKTINEHYIDYVSRIENLSIKEHFLELLKSNNHCERDEHWRKVISNIPVDQISSCYELIANPFFIGYGNPNSDLLIIGKELGFNISHNQQFYNESIQNIFLWEQILKNGDNNINVKDFNNPRRPYNGFIPRKSGHTWRFYQMVVDILIGRNHSFIDDCFITEYNHKPSSRSTGKKHLTEERKKLLSHNFYKRFKYIINTARSYDEGYTEMLFDVTWKRNIDIEDKKSLRTLYFENNDRKVVLTSQLSGLSGWSYKSINQLIKILKGDFNN